VKPKLLLIVLDGWGIAPDGPGNCLSIARLPFYRSLLQNYPHSTLTASGNAVGLPQGTMGTSEVGHLHMGAGRIVWQPLAKIENEIASKKFFKNKTLLGALTKIKKKKTALHLMGLCSDGKVHSDLSHLEALLEMAEKQKLSKVYLHFFADGRDVPEKSALSYIQRIEKKMRALKTGQIASVVGRFYAMDRDQNFDRTKKAFELLTEGKGFTAKTARDAVNAAYARNDATDYYIQPTHIDLGAEQIGLVRDQDTIIFFNTRTDRIRQLIKCFLFDDSKFKWFKRMLHPKVSFYSFVQTDDTIPTDQCIPIFNPEEVSTNVGRVIAKAGLRQLRIAETEKYAHVTYFFNSQVEKPSQNEERIMVPSAKVPSYDQKPEMSANEITNEALKIIPSAKFDFILINYANTDLVGHSANIPAIITAAETVDACLSRVVPLAIEKNYTTMITADHGNAEEKLAKTGEKIPSHSTNPVPFVLIAPRFKDKFKALKTKGELIDVAPTILALLNLQIPKEMTGKSLLKQ